MNPTSLAGYGGASLQSEAACAGNSFSNGIKFNEPSVPNNSVFVEEVIEPILPCSNGFVEEVIEPILPCSSGFAE